jgi:transposase-like protein
MHILSSMPRLKGFRFPREVVAYAVWTYHRFVNRPGFVGDHQLK